MAAFNYNRFVARWKETTELPTQNVGPLTGIYKRMTHGLKTMPFPMLIAISIILVCTLVVLLGPSITAFVSLLQ